ncbi:MAG: Ig-like domain-containing protein [Acidobacteriota bacterium]|nr:Ig-like domain-containing protein [Acidobacteriota bacterium]
MKVTPASATVYQGATMQFTAMVEGQGNQVVTWSIGQGGLGTIDSTGLYTAPKDASGGPIQIVATSQVVPSAKGFARRLFRRPLKGWPTRPSHGQFKKPAGDSSITRASIPRRFPRVSFM